jgi:hypothetical protein
MATIPNPDDLALIRATEIVTGRYAKFTPDLGVAVRATVGAPRLWRHGKMERARHLTPFGLLDPSMSDAAAERIFLQQLDDHARSLRRAS